MSLWSAIKRVGTAIKKCFSQPTQEEINEIPLIEDEELAAGQPIAGSSTPTKIIILLSAAGAMQYLNLIVGKVYFGCSEEKDEDKNCIAKINLAGSIIAYVFALTITLVQSRYGQLPRVKRNLEIFLDIFFKFPFIFQVASLAVGELENAVADNSILNSPTSAPVAKISNAAQWSITISYSMVALAIAITTNHTIRQKIRAMCCGSMTETELSARHFRENIALDDREMAGKTWDVIYSIFGKISDIRGLVAGGQNMLAALLCEPRSTFFPSATARWVPAVVIAVLFHPYAIINHPLKPIEFKSLFENIVTKTQQIADIGFFSLSLFAYILAAFICNESKILPAVKLGTYILTIMGIYGYDCCCPYFASQGQPRYDEEPPGPALLLPPTLPASPAPALAEEESALIVSTPSDGAILSDDQATTIVEHETGHQEKISTFSEAYQNFGLLKHDTNGLRNRSNQNTPTLIHQ